jgi:hypothetical protein
MICSSSPIFHQLEHRVEAHIFVAFLAYCLQVTLRAKLKPLSPGLTPRAVLDKLAAIQMLDVHFPTTDGRTLILSRYTEPNADQKLLVRRLKLDLPSQPPPRITAPARGSRRARWASACSGDLRGVPVDFIHFFFPIAQVGFCNGPWFVNPSFSVWQGILSPGSRFCPGSVRNRHLMGFERGTGRPI